MPSNEVEIINIDRKYEEFRLRVPHREGLLLSSIAERGIDDPISCSAPTAEGKYILIDGFKRLRCAEKLSYGKIKINQIGDDEVSAILHLIKLSNEKSLTMIEQAKLVDELHGHFKMTVKEIAVQLMRSRAWVCVRIQVLKDMNEVVVKKIMNGQFPLYSYLYTLRPFRRLNNRREVNEFIDAMGGKNLSTRDIEFLAKSYFHGDEKIRDEIKTGNFYWILEKMKSADIDLTKGNLSDIEQKCVKDLEIISKMMGRLIYRLRRSELLKSNNFLAQAELLTAGILKISEEFNKEVKGLYDRCRIRKDN